MRSAPHVVLCLSHLRWNFVYQRPQHLLSRYARDNHVLFLEEHPYAHVHVEIYPWLRMPDRLKYLAGSELGAGVFTADTLPEAKARELRDVEVP